VRPVVHSVGILRHGSRLGGSFKGRRNMFTQRRFFNSFTRSRLPQDFRVWTSRDLIQLLGGPRPYAYVHDPLRWVDVLGLTCGAQTELDARPLAGKSRAEIEAELRAQGFTAVPAGHEARVP